MIGADRDPSPTQLRPMFSMNYREANAGSFFGDDSHYARGKPIRYRPGDSLLAFLEAL